MKSVGAGTDAVVSAVTVAVAVGAERAGRVAVAVFTGSDGADVGTAVALAVGTVAAGVDAPGPSMHEATIADAAARSIARGPVTGHLR